MSIKVESVSVAVKGVKAAKDTIQDVHGFWRFKKCIVNSFYDEFYPFKLQSGSTKYRMMPTPTEFIVGFLVNTEHITGTLNPVIQVWEHYNPDFHSEFSKYNLTGVNGVVFKDMCKLTSRKLPNWISEINKSICDYVKVSLLLNHSDLFSSTPRITNGYKMDAMTFNGMNFFYGDNPEDLKNIRSIQASIARAVFDGVFKKIKPNWEEWEIPYGGDFFKEECTGNNYFTDDRILTEVAQKTFSKKVLHPAAIEIASQCYPECNSLSFPHYDSKQCGDLAVSPLEFKLKLRT